MKRISLSAINEKLQIVFKRFLVTIAMIAGLAFILFWSINKSDDDFEFPYWTFFIVGVLLSATVTLAVEHLKNCVLKQCITLVSVLLWGVFCFHLPAENVKNADIFQVVILGNVFFLSLFFVSFFKKNTDNHFWNFTVSTLVRLIISILFSLILFGGLALAIFALDSLFGVNIDEKVYGNLAVVCFALFAPIYFLATIPYKEEKQAEELQENKVFKVLGLYILFPLLAIYTAILYVYLLRVIVMWELPNGWVSTLVSILVGGGLLTILLLYPINKSAENKFVSWFSRYFGLIVLPLILLMSIGILRRWVDYGITVNRCYVLLLNIWFYGICIYLFISKGKHVKWIFISFVGIAFFSSLGPWSTFNVTKRTLVNQLKNTFEQADLLTDGGMNLSDFDGDSSRILALDSLQLERTEEAIIYLARDFGTKTLQPLFRDTVTNMSGYNIVSTLNFPTQINNYNWFSITAKDTKDGLDIAPFRYYLPISEYLYYRPQTEEAENIKFSYQNDTFIVEIVDANRIFSMSLINQIKSLMKPDSDYFSYSYPQEKLIIQGDDFRMYIDEISGEYYHNNDSIQIDNIKASLFYN